jgi:hypothetical protein
MRAAGLALVIGAWLIASSSPAPARADADEFAVEWIPAPEASSDTPVRIHDNHAVFGSRLLPRRLLITDADVIDGKGRLILPKDSELGFAEAPYPMACVINPNKIKRDQHRSFVANSVNTCLIDRDGDGRFEAWSRYESRYYSIGASGKVLMIQPVTPTPYREADPGTSKDYFTVYLRFEGWASSRKLSFSLCLNADAAYPCFTEIPALDVARLPASLDMMGKHMRVVAATHDDIDVILEKQRDPAPIRTSALWY